LSKLIRSAREVNDSKPDWVIEKVREKAHKFKQPIIGCLGIAYKADVDDLRESPALAIVEKIQRENIGTVLICEPNLKHHDEFELLPVEMVIERSDIILLLVDHAEFKCLKAGDLKEKVLIDTHGAIK
jgi:UDP-N-acetyl-D-mannosaminuronic acid dehydrogenase